jgi:hypothetical protein
MYQSTERAGYIPVPLYVLYILYVVLFNLEDKTFAVGVEPESRVVVIVVVVVVVVAACGL